MAKQPIAEVFGFPPDSKTPQAVRYRKNRLCPYNNKVPNCTKDKILDPLGVCSIFHKDDLAIICPVRLRQDWLIAEEAASFFFAPNARWTTLVEVRLNDKFGKSAGNIDVVLVAYDKSGEVTDFGSLEVQSVYISGNLRTAFFAPYMKNPVQYLRTNWTESRKKPPHPDYLSSSRKRLAPQLIYKGGILKSWNRKQAVAVHRAFFETLPELKEMPREEADMAWLVYDLVHDPHNNRYNLTTTKTVYTEFKHTLDRITLSAAPPIESFLSHLQLKLDAKLEGAKLETEDDLLDELENI